MSKSIQEALLDLKARQEAGEKMPCPRCGRDTMKPDLHTNALSRHADGIYVCDDCGTAEAMLDFMRNPLPLECWAQFREGEATADFKALLGEEALKTIKAEHVPRLIRIFQQWKAGTDFKALRITAMKECPGLTQIWEEPFQALYTVADGEIVIRFRENTISSCGFNAGPSGKLASGIAAINQYVESLVDASSEEDVIFRQDYREFLEQE